MPYHYQSCLLYTSEYSQCEDSFCEIVSIGKPLEDVQIRIANDNLPLGTYSVGEIQIKSNCVMLGYYNNAEANQNAFADGWLRTGDSGFFDKDGYLYIVCLLYTSQVITYMITKPGR